MHETASGSACRRLSDDDMFTFSDERMHMEALEAGRVPPTTSAKCEVLLPLRVIRPVLL